MAAVTDADRAALVRSRLADNARVIEETLNSELVELTATVAGRIVDALRSGGKVIFFGNGGSAMDAGHLAAEMLGRFYRDRPALAALSLPDATAAMTAIGNDYAYSEVFVRQLAGLGRAGDVAVALTTSGNSENVVRALRWAKDNGLVTVAFTGATGGRVSEIADLCIVVPTTDTPRVQEACMHLGHSVCEIVEHEMFPAPG